MYHMAYGHLQTLGLRCARTHDGIPCIGKGDDQLLLSSTHTHIVVPQCMSMLYIIICYVWYIIHYLACMT